MPLPRVETVPVTCLVPSADLLGEGCLWDQAGQALWWLDIARPSRIHRFEPASGAHRMWHSHLLLTTLALRTSGGLVLGGEDGVYGFDPGSGAITPLQRPEGVVPVKRFNDGACDPQGRLWIGTMQQNIGPMGEDLDITQDSGVLFRLGTDGGMAVVEMNVGVSNGPCWSPDGRTFYFSDSRNQLIYAYDFDGGEGRISNRRVLNDTKDHGYPDGATVDAEGFIWSARWDGSCVLRIDPKGRIDRIIAIPAQRPTCVCFGGAGMNTMYVTSSRAHLDAASMARFPLQGGLFCFNPGVAGTGKFSFAG
jgi:sugar lactone lactonase YvrE